MPFSAKFNKFKEKLKSKTGSEKQAPTETSETPDVTPTPPEPSVHSSVSDPIPISSNDNTEPWARAYEIVVSREPDLMEVYARHLASLQGETAENTDLSLPRSVESAMEQLVKIREEKQWRLSILGKDVKIREQVERLAKFVLWSEPIVTKALSAQPYAALGWSGVTLLLPLFVSGLESSEAMLQGFNSLADVQLYWHICETRYLNGQHVQVYKELFEPLAKLYSYIIEFHACAICHLSKSQTSRALKGMTDSNDWKGKVTTIDELSTKCSKMIPRLEVGEVREERDKVLQEMQQSQDILNEIRSLLQTESKQSQTIHKEQKTKDLLRDLISDHTPEDYKDFNPERVKGTCEWFFKDERFCEWRAATSSSILWVSASPGCGKSVLARALIDESRLSTSVTTSTVCYFFFKDGPEHRMQATDALSVILHQIFTKHPEKRLMIQHGLSRHAELGSGLTKNFSALWNIFVKCVESPNAGEIVVVLDALDECKRTSWLQLLEKLNKTYCDWHLSGNPPKLKFLITSRPYDDLKRDFKKFSEEPSYVPFEGDDKSTEISEEINLVIDARVKEIAKDFKEDDRHMIADRLKSMKNRTYLWLHLTFDIIDQSPCQYGRRAAVVELLSDLPAEVSDAYEKILERSKDSIQTTTLLEIVLVAARPLTLDEANLALTLALSTEGCTSHTILEEEIFPKTNFSSIVKNLCGLLISVHDSKLSFIHQTAREFLIHAERRGEWQGRLKTSNAHIKMSLACLQYLSFLDMPSSSEQLVSNFPWANYSAKHWMEHARVVETEQEVQKAISNFFQQGGHPYTNWEQLYEPESHQSFRRFGLMEDKTYQPLYYVSLAGLPLTAHSLLKEDLEPNFQAITFSSSLWAAVKNDHKDIVQLIVDSGAQIFEDVYSTALSLAARDDKKEILQILLHEVKLIAASLSTPCRNQDDYYDDALFEAAVYDRREITLLLLERVKTKSPAQKKDSVSPYPVASSGHEEVVKLLRERLVESTMSDLWGRTLRHAAVQGRADIVKLLTSSDGSYLGFGGRGGALIAAAAHGYEEIVRILLGTSIDPNTPFSAYDGSRNPIHAAAKNGHKEIVQLLINHKADIHTQGNGNPLPAAARYGHKEVVQLLLDSGAEVTTHDNHHVTVLDWTVRGGHEEILQLLLHAIHFKTQEEEYKVSISTLRAAAGYGQTGIIRLLLNRVDDAKMAEFCDTTLVNAAVSGHEEAVQLLLDHGADVNLKSDRFHHSALGAAAGNGHQGVVQLILGCGANIDHMSYSEALQAVAQLGHNEILLLLLDKADPDILVDHCALAEAVENGHKETVELLLARGADANAYGGQFGTALRASMKLQYVEIEQLLRANGADPSL